MPKYYRRGGALANSSLNTGRVAGTGITYDDYSEESGRRPVPFDKEYVLVRLPHDKDKPEDLNGPVIIVRKGKKEAATDEQDR